MDFEHWFASQGHNASAPDAGLLPEGLWEDGNCVMATCRACEESYKYEGDLDEFDLDMSYCGRHPWCLP
jgi:hypothetical protein